MFRKLFDGFGNEIGEISNHYGPVFDASGVQIGDVSSGGDGSVVVLLIAFWMVIGTIIAAILLVRLIVYGVIALCEKKYRAALAYFSVPVLVTLILFVFYRMLTVR